MLKGTCQIFQIHGPVQVEKMKEARASLQKAIDDDQDALARNDVHECNPACVCACLHVMFAGGLAHQSHR